MVHIVPIVVVEIIPVMIVPMIPIVIVIIPVMTYKTPG